MDYQSNEPKRVGVVSPLDDAFGVMKKVLFDPFSFEKWFLIGFCAWLCNLAMPSSGNNVKDYKVSNESFNGTLGDIQYFFSEHLGTVILIGMTLSILLIAIWLIFMWINSRAKFMFLDCIVRNYGGIKTPWTEYKHEGNSLFVFKIWIGVVMFLLSLAILALIGGLFFAAQSSGATVGGIVIVAGAFLFLTVTLSSLLVIQFTDDFVIPIMYIYRIKCTQAWGMLWSLIKNGNIGKFIWYHIFKSFLILMILAVCIVFGLLTCGIGCCCMAFPYVGAVITLPISVLMRAYSYCYLRQYGRSYDVYSVLVDPQISE
jgi:hypothetical protein